jgi:hypothetical protein
MSRVRADNRAKCGAGSIEQLRTPNYRRPAGTLWVVVVPARGPLKHYS